jgi:hypothetical protein
MITSPQRKGEIDANVTFRTGTSSGRRIELECSNVLGRPGHFRLPLCVAWRVTTPVNALTGVVNIPPRKGGTTNTAR